MIGSEQGSAATGRVSLPNTQLLRGAPMSVVLPPSGRDLRLDFFRGVANWWIFVDHIPNNIVNWLTPRNYGFSDAADLFVFISGYTAAFVYARMMLQRGFLIGASRLFRRVWQIYVAHVMLFVIYVAEIGWLATRYDDPALVREFNVFGFMHDPFTTLYEGLILKFKPVNLDVLPLYIVLMALFPPILWMMLRRRDLVLALSVLLYFAARHFGWNLPSYPTGVWYFNPFCWQLLFVFGAWCAFGGAQALAPLIRSWALPALGGAYLLFALVLTMAGRFPDFGQLLPAWLFDAFNPNDKTNLAPYRLVHFTVIVLLVVRFVPRDWRVLERPAAWPLMVCGQQSLEVFCVGVFLAFTAHFVLVEVSNTIPMQILVSVAGWALMTAVAAYRSWSKKVDKVKPAPAPPALA
jgi:hypothetical protein